RLARRAVAVRDWTKAVRPHRHRELRRRGRGLYGSGDGSSVSSGGRAGRGKGDVMIWLRIADGRESVMRYTRREIAKMALAALPAAAIVERPWAALAGEGREGAAGQAEKSRKPNSVIDGVHIGTITYSYRSMPDQSAGATLRYILD